ncbi:MAG: hypothetical protein IKQ45_05875 [Clostridia bacterium]|nr:hypothetical protein [Clostridia bacterium]
MKLMRSRIRLITLILTCLLIASVLWNGKTFLVPAGDSPVSSGAETSVPAEESSRIPEETPLPAAEPSVTPESLYDTFGL